MDPNRLKHFVIGLIVIVVSVSLHEFGHALSADRLGDPGPRRAGRITLWPDKHFEPLGLIMMMVTLWSGYGIGWGKPVMVDARNFRSPRKGMLIVAACGPLMNLLIAVVFSLALRLILVTHHAAWLHDLSTMQVDSDGGYTVMLNTFGQVINSFITINLSLMFFNLIPIHPLDGSKILSALLPFDLAVQYDRFVGTYGSLFLVIVAFSGGRFLGPVIGQAVGTAYRFLVG